jgi:hypothetical protein
MARGEALLIRGAASGMGIMGIQTGVAMRIEEGLRKLAVLTSLDRLWTIVRVEGRVNCGPGCTQHAKVLDGATGLLLKVLGEHAGHARTAFGHNEMPLNASVELVVTFAGYESTR